MDGLWSLVAVFVLSLLSGALTGGVALLIGGYGGILALARRLTIAEQRVEDTDQRITREVKRRAADAGVAARVTDPKKIAEAHLATLQPPAPEEGTRPSVVAGTGRR